MSGAGGGAVEAVTAAGSTAESLPALLARGKEGYLILIIIRVGVGHRG